MINWRFSNRSHITDMCNVFSAWYIGTTSASVPRDLSITLYYWYPYLRATFQAKFFYWLTACLPLWPPFRPMGNSLIFAMWMLCVRLLITGFPSLSAVAQPTFYLQILLGSRHMPRVGKGQTHQFLINKFSNFTFFSEMADPTLPVWFDCLASSEPGCEEFLAVKVQLQ